MSAKKPEFTAREKALYAEWDSLKKDNPKLFDKLWRLKDKLPSRNCYTGRYRALFLGICLGSAPSALADLGGMSWKIAIAVGFSVCMLSFSLWVWAWMLSSGAEDGVCYRNTPESLHDHALTMAAKADAYSEAWSEDDIEIIEKLRDIRHEVHRNWKEKPGEDSYIASLATFINERKWKER